jgi:hypothetical protein
LFRSGGEGVVLTSWSDLAMMVATLEILLKDGLSEFSCPSIAIGKFGLRQTQINSKPNNSTMDF